MNLLLLGAMCIQVTRMAKKNCFANPAKLDQNRSIIILKYVCKNRINENIDKSLNSKYLWPLKRPFCVRRNNFLSTFTTDTAGKLDILGHDGDTLGVDGAQVGIFEETDQVSF